MNTPDRNLPYTADDDDVELAKALRESAKRERVESRVTIETEVVPLWDRMRHRAKLNGFGEEYDLSVTPKPRRSA